jgi:type IX secretion system PorP/SprF family membrane protein
LYLNPAFAGTTPHYRLAAVYRNQWPSIPGAYQVNQFSFDFNWDYYDSGIGVLLTQDRLGLQALSATTVAFQYAYQVNLSRSWALRMGLQAGVQGRSADFSRYIFEDQLINGGATAEEFARLPVIMPDFSAGGLLFNKNFWFGFAAHHLLRPSQSLLDTRDRIERRFSFHTGFKILIDEFSENTTSLAPALLYQRQGIFDQLDMGVNFYYKPLLLGLWYRGLPVRQNIVRMMNQDAIALLAGVNVKGLMVAYSYDITISSLNRSGGAHEITVSYQPWYDRRNKRGTKHINCPVFF